MASDPHDAPRGEPSTSQSLRLERLRERRVFAPRDESLAFMTHAFKQEIARPFRQLEGVVDAWAQLVPEDLRKRSRLESLQRGVLTVAVDSSATHFVFDEHLRRGLAVKIAELSKGAVLRKIRLRVDGSAFADEPNDDAVQADGPLDPSEDFDPELPR